MDTREHPRSWVCQGKGFLDGAPSQNRPTPEVRRSHSRGQHIPWSPPKLSSLGECREKLGAKQWACIQHSLPNPRVPLPGRGSELGFSVRRAWVQTLAPRICDTPSHTPTSSLGSPVPFCPFPLLTVTSPFSLGMQYILRTWSRALPFFSFCVLP